MPIPAPPWSTVHCKHVLNSLHRQKSLVCGNLWITHFQREELEKFLIFLFGLLREWYFVICWLARWWALRRDQRWSLSEKSSYISCQVMSHRNVYDAARTKKERIEICICELDFIPYNKFIEYELCMCNCARQVCDSGNLMYIFCQIQSCEMSQIWQIYLCEIL